MSPSPAGIRPERSQPTGIMLALATLLLTSRAAAQSVMLDLGAEPLGTVEIQTISGASVVEFSEQGDWAPARPSLPAPAKIAIPPGSVVTLHGRDGIVLRVATDSQSTRKLVLHGNTIRLQNTIVGGKPRLVVLESDEGVLGPHRLGEGQAPTGVP